MFFILALNILAGEWKVGGVIQIESINKLVDDLNFLTKTLGGEESGREILSDIGNILGSAELKGIARERPVTICVLLPAVKKDSELNSVVPSVIVIIPLAQTDGADYLSAMEKMYGKPKQHGNVLQCRFGGGAVLFLKIDNGKCFLGFPADALEYIVSKDGPGKEIENASGNIQGSPKVCIDMGVCYPYIRATLSPFMNEFGEVMKSMPNAGGIEEMLGFHIEQLLDILSQLKWINVGIIVKPNYVEIVSRTDAMPGSKLETRIANLKPIPHSYLTAMPQNAYMAYAYSGTFMDEYTKLYFEKLKSIKKDDVSPAQKLLAEFMQLYKSCAEFNTGIYAGAVVPDRDGKGFGLISMSAIKEPEKMKKTIIENIKYYSDMVEQKGGSEKSSSQSDAIWKVKTIETRKHSNIEIMSFIYSLVLPEKSGFPPFIIELLREVKNEIAFLDNSVVSVIGTSRLIDEFIDTMKKGNGVKLTDSSVFKTLYPQFKGDVVTVYYVAPSRLVKAVLNSLPSVNPLLTAQLPVKEGGGVAGYSIVKDKNLLKSIRIDLGELSALKDMLPVIFMVALQSNLNKGGSDVQRNQCINNLRIIDAAKEQAALEGRLKEGDKVDMKLLQDYLPGGRMPVCPAGGVYTVNPVGTNPRCSVHGELP
jgi:hypothetical protein